MYNLNRTLMIKRSFDYTGVSNRQITGGCYKGEKEELQKWISNLAPGCPFLLAHKFVQLDFQSDQGDDSVKAHHKNFVIGATLDFSQVSS